MKHLIHSLFVVFAVTSSSAFAIIGAGNGDGNNEVVQGSDVPTEPAPEPAVPLTEQKSKDDYLSRPTIKMPPLFRGPAERAPVYAPFMKLFKHCAPKGCEP